MVALSTGQWLLCEGDTVEELNQLVIEYGTLWFGFLATGFAVSAVDGDFFCCSFSFWHKL